MAPVWLAALSILLGFGRALAGGAEIGVAFEAKSLSETAGGVEVRLVTTKLRTDFRFRVFLPAVRTLDGSAFFKYYVDVTTPMQPVDPLQGQVLPRATATRWFASGERVDWVGAVRSVEVTSLGATVITVRFEYQDIEKLRRAGVETFLVLVDAQSSETGPAMTFEREIALKDIPPPVRAVPPDRTTPAAQETRL